MSSARGFTVPVAKAPKFNHLSDMVAGSFKVTAVVAFYMFSALVVCLDFFVNPMRVLIPRRDGFRVGFSPLPLQHSS